jgi:23S rRNA pseudouridine1911/1915/1917 synthase
MKHIGHTLFADESYGGLKILKTSKLPKYEQFIQNCFDILPRQALHARTLGFIHPKTRALVHFESELAEDMTRVLEKLRQYTQAL